MSSMCPQSPSIHPAAEAEIESARTKVTLDEMRDFAQSEAARMSSMQRALIDSGHRSEPDAGQIRRIVVADAVVALVEMFARHEVEARRLFSQLERKWRSAA